MKQLSFHPSYLLSYCCVKFVKKLLGEKIKRLRKARGLTQEEFAEMIDIAPRNLSRIEVGESFVSADTLDKILIALNIEFAEKLWFFLQTLGNGFRGKYSGL